MEKNFNVNYSQHHGCANCGPEGNIVRPAYEGGLWFLVHRLISDHVKEKNRISF